MLNSLTSFIHDKTKLNTIWTLGFLLFGLSLSMAVAYLIVDGNWTFALGLIVAVPALLLLQEFPLLGLMIWLLLTPFAVVTDGGTMRKIYWLIHRALPVVMVGIIVVKSLLHVDKRKLPGLGWGELAMAGYVVVSVVSIIYLSENVQATFYIYYDRVIIPMMLYLFVRLTNLGEQDLRWLLPVLIFIVISQSIIGILSWVAPQFLPSYWLNRQGLRTTGSLRSYSVFASTMVFCGLVILHMVLSGKLQSKRPWYLALVSLTFFMVFFSFSRGSWLGGMLVVLGLFYIYPKFILRYVTIAVPIVAIVISGGMLSNYASYAGQRLYSDNSEQTALSRLPVFYASYRMFQAKPLFGWGYTNFDRYDRQFQERVAGFSPVKDHASHNVYLTLIAEQGAIGLSLFLAPVFWWLMQTMRVWSRMPTAGVMNRNLVFLLWLVILDHVVVNNFSNMKIVFGLGLWWITLGLIATLVSPYLDRNPDYQRQLA